MSLFQKSVLSKYLNGIDEDALATQWQIFKQHFHNPTIQQNIRQSKEEQYQEGFLDDLFVKVLGYTKNPEPNFNLTTELKNISNAKKTDGAIIINNKTIAVIELKGTNTTDLSKVETQAFQYKNNQPDAVYVITSNFEKLRFYIDNAVDFLEFNLFQLNQADFKLMWLCLAHQNLSRGIAKQVKEESLFNEENITKKLYKDYSTFKNELFASIQKDNPQYDKLTLYKKTQKLLDRFLFIFFAEDRLLLPPNSIRAILKQWEQLKDLDEYQQLYSRYKKYFGYMNTGYKGKQHDIFAYNGGLFAADDILDSIKIDDEVLATHTQNLSQYDFESEVSVNILGHIFEHSLNEIEAITAELEGKALDAKKTKRKKDGVFYTPKYITKYIVENTVGKLCIEKKTDLNINEADYAKERKGRKKETLKKLQQQLESYRNWLLSLTICDPACGSGAFLNQALEFLITEHRYIDELQAKLLNEPMVFSDIENAILENNLFGVDINEESVDIAKLSLWLRTAQKGRKLTTLSSNIKCGNSLIDDPAVAGAKAFNWQNEFPQVFEPKDKQAFHIVLTTHNSRTSQRMRDYKIKPGEAVELDIKQEIKLTQIIGNIILEQGYHCLAYNVCKNHVHLILVCTPEDLSRQVKRIKSVSSRLMKISTPPTEPVPLPENRTSEQAYLDGENAPMEPVPLTEQKEMKTASEQVHLERGTDPKKPVPLSETSEQVHLEEAGGTHKKGNKYYTPFWSQKFYHANLDVWALNTGSANGYRYGDNYINNAITYIQNNRIKHQLPVSQKLENLIETFVATPEKAFEPEFTGGFDVIIGNPPYGASLSIEIISHYRKTYQSIIGHAEIYYIFTEKAIRELTKENGQIGYIIPNAWLSNKYAKKIREIIIFETTIQNLLNFNRQIVFEDAQVETSIFILKNTTPKKESKSLVGQSLNKLYSFLQSDWTENHNHIISFAENKEIDTILKKVNSSKFILSDRLDISNGFKPYQAGYGINDAGQPLTKDDVKKRIYHSSVAINKSFKKEIKGKGIKRYSLEWEESYIKWGKWLMSPKSKHYFEQPKILLRQVISDYLFAYLDKELFYADQTLYVLINYEKQNESLEFYTALLNSKLYGFYFRKFYSEEDDLFPKIKVNELKNLPIKNFDKKSKERLTKLSIEISNCIKDYHQFRNKLMSLLISKYQFQKLSKKLQNWPTLEFADFLKELKKAKVKLSLSEEAEWMQYFNDQKAIASDLQKQINQTDTEIDQMVYQLYGLTEEEIKIVGENVYNILLQ